MVDSCNFAHRQTAHCESGTVAALLRHAGLDLSEPMVFGLSGALTFAYLPLLKGVTSRLKINMQFERFKCSTQGMDALDAHLQRGRPVGLQASVFWLPYFPEDMRFHFNAHNLVVYGRSAQRYLISDPTFEHPVESDYEALQHARFVKGMLAPKGLLYYPTSVPQQPDLPSAIVKAIRGTVNMMLRTPLPIIGVRGIRFVAARIRKLDKDKHSDFGKLFIGHMVRMQEEIGTGGAGFRFLYASFLQESAALLDKPELLAASRLFTDTGDEWRRFALYAAKMLKGRMPLDYHKLADQLLVVADMEARGYRQLEAALA
jgi:hypothetical protein